ncbi:MAG: hypothetical protein ACRYE9_04475 [Janthinobacterium lividum]
MTKKTYEEQLLKNINAIDERNLSGDITLRSEIKNILEGFSNVIKDQYQITDMKTFGASFRHDLANLEGNLLSIDGIESAEFILNVKATSAENSNSAIVKNGTIGIEATDSTFHKLMLEHPEYKFLGTILSKLMEQEHLNGVSELQYRMQKLPVIKEILDGMNLTILPREFKHIVSNILQDYQRSVLIFQPSRDLVAIYDQRV